MLRTDVPVGRWKRSRFIAGGVAAVAVLALAVSAPTLAIADTVVGTIPSVSPGSTDRATALSPDGTRLYAAGGGAGTVTSIDTATGAVIDTVSIGTLATSITVSPDGTRLYVPRSDVDAVVVLDAANLAVLATVPVLDNPHSVAVTPNGAFAYVTRANGLTGQPNVAVIDTATNAVTATVIASQTSRAIAISPDGSSVYVGHFSPSAFNVSEIDVATNTLVGTVVLDSFADRITSLAFTPDGSKLYAAQDTADALAIIDPATNSITGMIPVGDAPGGVRVTADGTRAYVTNVNSDTVTVVDTATDTVASTISVGDGPRSITISPDNLFAYVTNTLVSTVSVIALDTFPTITTTSLPNGTEDATFAATIVTTGTPAPTLAVTAGTFPTGLAIDPLTGAITGTPDTAGTYTFTVTASSSVSGIASAVTREYTIVIASVPIAPSAPLNLDANLDGTAIDLTWTAPASDGGSTITGYRIERSVDGGPFTVLVADTASPATRYSDAAITAGSEYSYRVIALNATGAGAESNIDTVNVPPAGAGAGNGGTGAATGGTPTEPTGLANTGVNGTIVASSAAAALTGLALGVLLLMRRRSRAQEG